MTLTPPGDPCGVVVSPGADDSGILAPFHSSAGHGRIGVIDVGSNSIRLVVFDRLSRMPWPVFNEKVLCGLGRGAGESGRLDPDGVIRGIESLRRFKALAEAMRLSRLDVIATAAVRDAEDGPAFVERVETECGLKMRVISGEEEARLSALGVISGIPWAEGLIGDLGGGSLELVTCREGEVEPKLTLPLGHLRLAARYQGDVRAAIAEIDARFAALPWLAEFRRRPFYAVGGDWRAIGRLHIEQTEYPLHVIHHYAIAGDRARAFAHIIAFESRSTLDRITTGSGRRNETLPFAALVLERLCQVVQPKAVVFSAFGLREGYLYDLLSEDERRQDPMFAFCSDLAGRFDRYGAAPHLDRWTSGLFTGENPETTRLRRATCMLGDIGWIEHPDYRAENAFTRILRLPFAGLDHLERAFLALALFARHSGRIDMACTGIARELLTEGQCIQAHVLGLALRLAFSLTGGVMDALGRSTLTVTSERVEVTLPETLAPLVGEVPRRRLEALARVLERPGNFVFVSPAG